MKRVAKWSAISAVVLAVGLLAAPKAAEAYCGPGIGPGGYGYQQVGGFGGPWGANYGGFNNPGFGGGNFGYQAYRAPFGFSVSYGNAGVGYNNYGGFGPGYGGGFGPGYGVGYGGYGGYGGHHGGHCRW